MEGEGVDPLGAGRRPVALRRTELLCVGLGAVTAFSHRVLPVRARLVANLGAAGASVALARRAGLAWSEMGLDPRDGARGLRWGSAAAGAVAAVVAVAGAGAPGRERFADERVAAHGRRGAAYEMAFRIPVETALAEEVLFRGTFLGLARRGRCPAVAIGGQAVLFGVWHVLPTLADLDRSALGSLAGPGVRARAGVVAGVVLATTVAGAAFAGLRLGSRSMVAPVMAHAAVNVTSFAVARAAARRADREREAGRR